MKISLKMKYVSRILLPTLAISFIAPVFAMQKQVIPMSPAVTTAAHYPQQEAVVLPAQSMYETSPAKNNVRGPLRYALLPCALTVDALCATVPTAFATACWCLACCDTDNCKVYPSDFDGKPLPVAACHHFATCPATRRLCSDTPSKH